MIKVSESQCLWILTHTLPCGCRNQSETSQMLETTKLTNSIKFIWLVVLTILKHISHWEGWQPIYEMENKIHVWNILKPPTSHRNSPSIEDLHLLPRFPSHLWALPAALLRSSCRGLSAIKSLREFQGNPRVFRCFSHWNHWDLIGFWWILVCGFEPYPSEKWWTEFVSWDDEIPNWMEQENSCSKPPISDLTWFNFLQTFGEQKIWDQTEFFHFLYMFKIAFGCFWPSVAVPSPLSIERECFKSGLWCLCLKKNVGIALDCLTLERTIPKHSKTCLWASATHQKHFFLPPLPLSFQIWRHMGWSENWRETWGNPSNLMAHISSSLFPHFGYPPIFSRWRNFGPLTSGPSTFCFFVADSSTCSGSDSEKWSISAGKTKTPSADLQLEAKILSFHFSRCWCLMSNRWEGASAASQPGDWSEWHGDEAPVIPT